MDRTLNHLLYYTNNPQNAILQLSFHIKETILLERNFALSRNSSLFSTRDPFYIARSIVLPACLCFTLFMFGPIELYATNQQEFWFSLKSLLPGFASLFLVGTIVLSVLLFILPSKQSSLFASVLLAITIGIYLEGNFLSRGYPLLTGDSIDWSSLRAKGYISTAIWIILIASSIWICLKKKKLFQKTSLILPAFILSVEAITLLTVALIQKPSSSKNSETCYFSSDQLYVFSKQKNIIVIILDSLEGPRFESTISELNTDPSELFPGFVYYPDTTGIGEYTVPSMTMLLTESHFPISVPQEEAISQNFSSATIYDQLHNHGYSTRLFTFDTFATPAAVGKVDNIRILSAKPHGKLLVTMTKQFIKLVFYRYMPHYFKHFFTHFGLVFDMEEAAFSDQYYVNDLSLWNALDKKGVQADTDSSLYSLYHFNGMHSPYRLSRDKTYKEYSDDVPEEDRAKEQGAASLSMIAQLFKELQKAGIYDTSAIILSADHGSKTRYRFVPAFLIKFPGSSDEFSISDHPVSLDAQYFSLLRGLADGSITSRSEFESLCDKQSVRKVYRYDYSGRWEGAASSVTEILVNGPATELSSYSIDLFQ